MTQSAARKANGDAENVAETLPQAATLVVPTVRDDDPIPRAVNSHRVDFSPSLSKISEELRHLGKCAEDLEEIFKASAGDRITVEMAPKVPINLTQEEILLAKRREIDESRNRLGEAVRTALDLVDILLGEQVTVGGTSPVDVEEFGRRLEDAIGQPVKLEPDKDGVRAIAKRLRPVIWTRK